MASKKKTEGRVDRKIEIKYMNPHDLKHYVNNSKEHTDKQIGKIAKQIHEFGFDQPVAIDEKGVILKGHGRTLAAISLDMDEIPVVVVDGLSEKEKISIRIADNKVAESNWIDEMLRFDIGTLIRDDDFDMSLTGFDESSINRIMSDGEIAAIENTERGEYQEKHLLTIECRDKEQLQALYDELLSRGMKATMASEYLNKDDEDE